MEYFSGWNIFAGIIFLTFIVVWALLINRPDQQEVEEMYGHGESEPTDQH